MTQEEYVITKNRVSTETPEWFYQTGWNPIHLGRILGPSRRGRNLKIDKSKKSKYS